MRGRERENSLTAVCIHRGVLLLEKDVHFKHLRDIAYSEAEGLILVHAKGQPDVASRALVRAMATQLPTLPLMAAC